MRTFPSITYCFTLHVNNSSKYFFGFPSCFACAMAGNIAWIFSGYGNRKAGFIRCQFQTLLCVNAGNASYIVMDAPPEKENIEPFIRVATVFEKSGVSVPRILGKNHEEGFLLLSDLGTTTYLDSLDESNAGSMYMDAILSLIHI